MKTKTVLFRSLAIASIIAILLCCGACSSHPKNDVSFQAPITPTNPSVQSTPSPTTKPSVLPSAQAATKPPVSAPKELMQLLANQNANLYTLEALGCTQLVTVAVTRGTAEIDYYSLEGNRWVRNEALSCSGFVGRNGVSANKREGDGTTPTGLYPICDAFYISEKPKTGLNTFHITKDTYWVDDPASIYYNKHVEGTKNKDWQSAERMSRYTYEYAYGFVVGYNLEAVPYAGSAIFFHVSDHSTAGCIGTQESFVLKYLALLNKNANPHILIQ